MIIYPDK